MSDRISRATGIPVTVNKGEVLAALRERGTFTVPLAVSADSAKAVKAEVAPMAVPNDANVKYNRPLAGVACHEHGTGVAGFLPGSWDHLDCQSWDHPACRAGGSWVSSLDRRVGVAVMEVYGRGIQGGQCG